MQVLQENIEDERTNFTRFLILDPRAEKVENANKASLILRTSHAPGALYRSLGVFANLVHESKALSYLSSDPKVCINFSTDHHLRYQNEEVACSWSMKYRSVLCYGQAEFITDPDEKIKALNIIMHHYTKREFRFNPPSIREVNVIRIRVERFEGRKYGY